MLTLPTLDDATGQMVPMRIGQYTRYVFPDGTVSNDLMKFRERWPEVGINEIPDPARGNDRTQTTEEINPPPYVVIRDKPPAEIEAARVAALDAQILGLERQALEQGLVRTLIDDLMTRSLAIAAQAGVSEAQLLDPESPHYSRAYAKVHANAAERAALRAQR